MRILKVIKNQGGIFLTAKYLRDDILKLGDLYALEYNGNKYYFEIVEIETDVDKSLICYFKEVEIALQEMLEEKNPHLLSELEKFDIRDILYTCLK